MNAAPLGSVARVEAAQEVREIRAILDVDRLGTERLPSGIPGSGRHETDRVDTGLALADAVTSITRERSSASAMQSCPACGAIRVGSFRFCRSCGRDFEGEPASRRPIAPSRASLQGPPPGGGGTGGNRS